MQTAMEAMRDFNTLLKEEQWTKAADYVASLHIEQLRAFTRAPKCKAIAVLHEQSADCIRKAMTAEYFNDESEPLTKKLLLAIEAYKGAGVATGPATVVEEAVDEDGVVTEVAVVKAPVRRSKRVKLTDMEGLAFAATSREDADTPAAAPAVAPVVPLPTGAEEAPTYSPFENNTAALDELKMEIKELRKAVSEDRDMLNNFGGAMKELVDAFNKNTAGLVSLQDKLLNAQKNAYLMVESVWYALVVLGSLVTDTSQDDVVAMYSTGKDFIKKRLSGE